MRWLGHHIIFSHIDGGLLVRSKCIEFIKDLFLPLWWSQVSELHFNDFLPLWWTIFFCHYNSKSMFSKKLPTSPFSLSFSWRLLWVLIRNHQLASTIYSRIFRNLVVFLKFRNLDFCTILVKVDDLGEMSIKANNFFWFFEEVVDFFHNTWWRFQH